MRRSEWTTVQKRHVGRPEKAFDNAAVFKIKRG
jgi:hypothetical protein